MSDKHWTGEDFTRFATALLGTTHGWQSAIARQLGVSSRTVRRWVKDGPPPAVCDELLRMAGVEDDSGVAFPRDEWILGDAGGRGYIIHTRPPRFIARVVEISEADDGAWIVAPDEEPADIDSGVVYRAAPDAALCEILWIDRVPVNAELVTLMEAASNVLIDG